MLLALHSSLKFISSSACSHTSSSCCWVHCGTLLYPVFLRHFSDWPACQTTGLNGHIMACDALDIACQVNMQSSADEIIQHGTHMSLFFCFCVSSLSFPSLFFCNSNGSKNMFTKIPTNMLRRPEKIQRKLEMCSGWDLSEFPVHCTLLIYGEPPCIIQMADALCLSLCLVHSARLKFQRFRCSSPMPATIMKQQCKLLLGVRALVCRYYLPSQERSSLVRFALFIQHRNN